MSEKRRRVIFFILFFASLMVFYIASQEDILDDVIRGPSIDPKSPEVEKRVNQHLKTTAREIETQQLHAQGEAMSLPKVGEHLWKRAEQVSSSEMGVDLSTDSSEDLAYRDLNRHPKEYGNIKSPHSVIQNERAAQESEERNKRAAKEEYVRQFIENARRGGYLVKVNADLVVVSVQKLRTPGSQFDQPNLSGAK
jgi:hypothetical protein